MKIERLDNPVHPFEDELVKVKETGNITSLSWNQHRGHGSCITKLNQNEFVDNRTGEVREFHHLENRAGDLASVARSLQMGRDLINTNVTDVALVRWVTLTYAENMTDSKQLMRDFQVCVKRLRKVFGYFEYIVCAEPQGRGAWHLHALFLFAKAAPFMDENKLTNEWWGHGYCKVKKLTKHDGSSVDNVGAYLTAYLGDVALDEASAPDRGTIKEVEILNDDGSTTKKKFIKGGRLHLYPPQFHIFRWSKGIQQPEITYMSEKNAQKKVSGQTLTFEKTVQLTDTETDFGTVLNYRYYNKLRKIEQQDTLTPCR